LLNGFRGQDASPPGFVVQPIRRRNGVVPVQVVSRRIFGPPRPFLRPSPASRLGFSLSDYCWPGKRIHAKKFLR
jgi:hypothetical protein